MQGSKRIYIIILIVAILTAAVETNAQSNRPALLRGPYLQMVTSKSAVIRWRTDSASQGRVRFGTNVSTLTSYVDDSIRVNDHEIKLTGLLPYTKYYYSIGTLRDTLQGDTNNYFRTLPVPGTADKTLRIGVFGDCGNASTNQINVRNQLISYLGSNYMDSWILLGDNAYGLGYDIEYQSHFFNVYKDRFLKQSPLWPAPGNHDYANSPARQNDHNIPYYTNFTMPTQGEAGGVASGTEAYYSYDIGNVHFISLDSYGNENYATRLYDTLGAQVTWLKKDLDSNVNKQWKVVYFHHAPYTKGSHHSDYESELLLLRQNLLRILERYGVDLVLTGHSHDYERSKLMKGHYGTEGTFNASVHNLDSSSGKYNGSQNSCPYKKTSIGNDQGTIYVVSGSAGALGGMNPNYPHSALPYSNATIGGSMMLEFTGNRLDAKWICSDGVIRDQFTIMKNVDRKTTYSISLGDSVELSASFNGTYNWNVNGLSGRTVKVKPATGSTTYTVTDAYTCVRDSFIINIASLPVIWGEFKAWNDRNGNTLLSWETVTEINNRYFEVQRSADMKNFIKAGTVDGGGNSAVVNRYTFTDYTNTQNNVLYYRIKQVDYSGNSDYSKTIRINKIIVQSDELIDLKPNPSRGNDMKIKLSQSTEADVRLMLTDVSGMNVYDKMLSLTDKFETFLPADIKPGFYFLTVSAGENTVVKKILIR